MTHMPEMLSVGIPRAAILGDFLSQITKSIATLAIVIILGVSATMLPGLVSRLATSAIAYAPKQDRPAIRLEPDSCAQQVWPHFDRSCLHGGAQASIEQVRLIDLHH
jgi:hypothetical protein